MNSHIDILELFVNFKKRVELYLQTISETDCHTSADQEKELFDFINKCQSALIECSQQLKKTNDALRKNELQLTQILKSMDDYVFTLDHQHRFVSVNAPDKKLYVEQGQFIGRKVSDVLPSHINTLYLQALDKLRTSDSAEFEYELEMGEEIRWYHLKLTPIRQNGTFIGSVAVVRDTTTKKQVEKELKEKTERYYSFFEQAADSIVLIHGETGALVEFNRPTYENLGYSREEFEKLAISDFEFIESKQEVEDHIKIITANGSDSFETQHRTKNNEIRDIHVSAKALSISGKTFIHAIWRDITNFKRLESSLQDSNERYRALSESTFNSVLLTENGIIQDANTKASSMFGYSYEEFIGRPITSLLAPEPPNLHNFSLLTKEQIPFETVVIAKNGKRFHAEIKSTYSKYQDRQVQIIVINDIDSYKNAMDSLKNIHNELEDQVRSRTQELEAMNSALKVLLDKREVDKLELEDNILSNVKTLVQPYIERLQHSGIHEPQRILVDILESNLNEIVAPFSRTLSSKLLNLTPTEIQVSHLVKQGKTSKEIADVLSVSERTIAFHRENIRKKLGIKHKKTNLQTYLYSIE